MPTDDILALRALVGVKRKETFYVIKAGSTPARCDGCNADHLYWGTSQMGARLLVDCASSIDGAILPSQTQVFPEDELREIGEAFVLGAAEERNTRGETPRRAKLLKHASAIDRALAWFHAAGGANVTISVDGRGVSHFVTCPARDRFSKARQS